MASLGQGREGASLEHHVVTSVFIRIFFDAGCLAHLLVVLCDAGLIQGRGVRSLVALGPAYSSVGKAPTSLVEALHEDCEDKHVPPLRHSLQVSPFIPSSHSNLPRTSPDSSLMHAPSPYDSPGFSPTSTGFTPRDFL